MRIREQLYRAEQQRLAREREQRRREREPTPPPCAPADGNSIELPPQRLALHSYHHEVTPEEAEVLWGSFITRNGTFSPSNLNPAAREFLWVLYHIAGAPPEEMFKIRQAIISGVSFLPNVTRVNTALTFKTLAGVGDISNGLRESIVNPYFFTQMNSVDGGNVLLYGPPGTGKTAIANAIANEARIATGGAYQIMIFNVNASEFMGMYMNESSKNIALLFLTISAYIQGNPRVFVVLFIDEVDSAATARELGSGGAKEGNSGLREMLLWMEKPIGYTRPTVGGVPRFGDTAVMAPIEESGIELGAINRLMFVSGTNLPWRLDPAFLSRINKKVFVPMPTWTARRGVLTQLFVTYFLAQHTCHFFSATGGSDHTGHVIDAIKKKKLSVPVNEALFLVDYLALGADAHDTDGTQRERIRGMHVIYLVDPAQDDEETSRRAYTVAIHELHTVFWKKLYALVVVLAHFTGPKRDGHPLKDIEASGATILQWEGYKRTLRSQVSETPEHVTNVADDYGWIMGPSINNARMGVFTDALRVLGVEGHFVAKTMEEPPMLHGAAFRELIDTVRKVIATNLSFNVSNAQGTWRWTSEVGGASGAYITVDTEPDYHSGNIPQTGASRTQMLMNIGPHSVAPRSFTAEAIKEVAMNKAVDEMSMIAGKNALDIARKLSMDTLGTPQNIINILKQVQMMTFSGGTDMYNALLLYHSRGGE